MKPKKKNYLKLIRILLLSTVVVIGSYGIITAPASDRSDMEAAIQQNAEQLAQAQKNPGKTTDRHTDAASPSKESKKAKKKKTKSSDSSISVIGDSVFLCAASDFQKIYPKAVIDAKISRQVFQAIDIVKEMKQKKQLGHTVILALGNNGNFNPATGETLLDEIGSKRKIYWIMPYGSDVEHKVYQTIRNVAKPYKNVHLIPWNEEAPKHPSWFYQDGTHPNPTGAKGYAKFIHRYLKNH